MRLMFWNNNSANSRPAIFLDRDGVVNQRIFGSYVLEWPQFVFVPGIRESLKKLATLKLPLIIISNQAAVGKGLLPAAELQYITEQMNAALLEDGTSVSAVYYCTHRVDERCHCRKPRAQLFQQAERDFGLDLERSIFIGDSETDVQAARSAKCQPVLFGNPLTSDPAARDWITGVPIAPKPEELFDVAVDALRLADARKFRVTGRDSMPQTNISKPEIAEIF